MNLWSHSLNKCFSHIFFFLKICRVYKLPTTIDERSSKLINLRFRSRPDIYVGRNCLSLSNPSQMSRKLSMHFIVLARFICNWCLSYMHLKATVPIDPRCTIVVRIITFTCVAVDRLTLFLNSLYQCYYLLTIQIFFYSSQE